MRAVIGWMLLALPLTAACGGSSSDDTDDGTVDTIDGTDGAGDADAAPDVALDGTGDGTDGARDGMADDTGPRDGDGLDEGVREDVGPTDAEDTATDGGTPGVDCGGAVCAEGEECCFTTPPPTLACVTAGSCSGGVFNCDEAADCDAGQVCCHDPAGGDTGAQCVDTCDGIPVCGDASECTAWPGRPYCCPAMGGLLTICRDTDC